jgi:DNA mismatch repair protein MutL
MIIDQHRAHLKILYEEYLRMSVNAETVSQRVMFPDTITLDSSQQAALQEVESDLEGFGFMLEYESGNEWSICGIPTGSGKLDAKDVVLRILDSVTDDSANYGKDAVASFSVRERMALIMARSAAVRRGDRLSVKEMESIVAQLFSLPDPSLTPNGNPVFHILTPDAISRLL